MKTVLQLNADIGPRTESYRKQDSWSSEYTNILVGSSSLHSLWIVLMIATRCMICYRESLIETFPGVTSKLEVL